MLMKLINRARNAFRKLPDSAQAALRTFFAVVAGGVLSMVFALNVLASRWLGGLEVDWLSELSNQARALGLVVNGAWGALVSAYMNRGDKGATYAPAAADPTAKPPTLPEALAELAPQPPDEFP